MARKSNEARDNKRANLVIKHAKKRTELRALSKQGDEKAIEALQKLPRDSSSSRNIRRCACCGRPRATLRRFGVCRICLRTLTMQGLIPGIKKSSW